MAAMSQRAYARHRGVAISTVQEAIATKRISTLPDGQIAYTRDGNFNRDGNGNVVTADGYFLDPPVQIPVDASQVQITPAGQIMMTPNNSTQQVQIGQIELTRFVNPSGLQDMGSNLFLQTAASGDPINGLPGTPGFPAVQQGALEQSNVDVTSEMVNLIVAQRAFELNSRTVSTADTMLETVSNMKQFP